MIRQVLSKEELYSELERYPIDILCCKIKALAEGYGFGYPFLRFFIQENAVLSVYYGSAIICGTADEEIFGFLKSISCGEILLNEYEDGKFGTFSFETLYIMEYTGEKGFEKISLKTDTPYERVYEILREGFNISFDDWYTDTCHNVRHGISEVFTYDDKATATKMFGIGGISLISLVAVKKSARGKGLGGLLIKNLSERLCESSKVYVICEKELKPFYEKNGYKFYKNCIQIKTE